MCIVNCSVIYCNLFQVNQKLGVSPGTFTSKLALLHDLQHKKRKAISVTRAAKQWRIRLKTRTVFLIMGILYLKHSILHLYAPNWRHSFRTVRGSVSPSHFSCLLSNSSSFHPIFTKLGFLQLYGLFFYIVTKLEFGASVSCGHISCCRLYQ